MNNTAYILAQSHLLRIRFFAVLISLNSILPIFVGLHEPAAASEMKNLSAYEVLRSHQTVDPYQMAARERVLRDLETLSARIALPEYELVIIDAPPGLKDDLGSFYTTACRNVPKAHQSKSLIICNEDYLYEVEAAIRANEMASVYEIPPFYTDPAIFSFVRQLIPQPKAYALSLRSKAQYHSDSRVVSNEDHIREHMELALLFFVGHELGHLHEQDGESSLVTIFSPDAGLVQSAEQAVLRTCRHAEEFWKEGNTLAHYEWIKTLGHDIEQDPHFSEQLRRRYKNTGYEYQGEISGRSVWRSNPHCLS